MPNLLDPQGQPESPQGADVARAVEPVADARGPHVCDEDRELVGEEARAVLGDFFRGFDGATKGQR